MRDVSVVIPTYNGSCFVGEALESVYDQTRRPDEILVVDDASTDGTPNEVQRLLERSPVPSRLIALPANSGGPAHPLNVGIEAARGEVIAVLDQDDVLAPDKLEVQTAALNDDPSLRLVLSWCGGWNQREKIRQSDEVVAANLAVAEDRGGYLRLQGAEVLAMLVRHSAYMVGYPGFLFRRSDWKQKGGLDESLRIASDYDLVAWLCTQGDVALVPTIAFYRREHQSNACQRRVEMYSECCVVRERILRGNRFLLQDAALSRAARERFLGLAYWFAKGGYYAQAARLYRQARRIWGLDAEIAGGLAKLPLHWFNEKCLGRRPVASPFVQAGNGEDSR